MLPFQQLKLDNFQLAVLQQLHAVYHIKEKQQMETGMVNLSF